MADVRERRAREIQEAIREVLYQEWDPLALRGLAPRDEYDSYIGGVYRILASSRSEEALVEFLGRTGGPGSSWTWPRPSAFGGPAAPCSRCAALAWAA